MQNHKTGRNKPKTQGISCAFSSHAHPKRVQKKKMHKELDISLVAEQKV